MILAPIVGSVVLMAFLVHRIHRINNPKGPVTAPKWYQNPAYPALGNVTEEWLCEQKRTRREN